MIVGAWLFMKGVFNALMRVSIPLLLAGVVLMMVSSGLIWKWGVADHGRKKAEARALKLDEALRSSTLELAACHGSVDRLTATLEIQNAAVDALKAESDQRAKRANAAIRKANEQARALRVKVSRLERSTPSGDVCESARNLIIESLREDRS